MNLRKELVIVLGAVLVGWMVLMIGLAKWQRSRPGHPVVEPELPHYPGTQSVEEQTSPNLGLRKYWFKLEEDYPSQTVFNWYQKELQGEGWRLLGSGHPQWSRQPGKGELYDVFHATWVEPRGLFQIDLEMMSTVVIGKSEVGEETQARKPGMEVFVTLRRTLVPGFVLPPEKAPARDEIEVR